MSQKRFMKGSYPNMSSIRNINIVFMGTPDFAIPSLQALRDDDWQIKAVFTQPDRPKGRRRTLTPPPVKETAEKLGIPVFQPEKMASEEGVAMLQALKPDLIVTAAYGQILPQSVLDIPRLGCINVHASLLPKYRGGAPIHHAIIDGESTTGVTLMYMAEGLDTGDMIAKTELAIDPDDTVGTMFDKLKTAGAQLLIETMPTLAKERVVATKQDDAEATYAPNITAENERIRWDANSLDVYNRVRGLNPWPGAFTTWNVERIIIWARSEAQTSALKS